MHTGKIKHNRESMNGIIFSYLQIIIGCILGGAAYPLFLTPGNIAPGGLTGVAMVVNYLFHWPVGTVYSSVGMSESRMHFN